MDSICLVLVAAVAGIAGFLIGKNTAKKECVCEPTYANEAAEKKAANLAKIEDFIARADRFTNDDLEKLLGVSNATVGRYLQELEDAGKIRQVGTEGRFVYYTKA